MPLAGRFVVQSVSALLVVGLLALVGIVAVTIWLNERARTHFEDVIVARGTRSAAVELRSAVQSAESSERGYVLTGNEIYLSPYGTAKTQAFRQLETLRQKVDDGWLPPVLPRLSTAVTQKFAELDRVIQLKQDRKDAEVLGIIRTNRGKALMDEINLFVSGIAQAADDRLTSGVAEQRANATFLRLTSFGAALVIALVVGGIIITVYRYTREITAARDQLNAFNNSLEARVAARTAELAHANDEIQRFAQIVSHDLRAPLVNIVGFTSEIEESLATLQTMVQPPGRDEPGTAQARTAIENEIPEALSFIRSSTRKMDTLINAILMISREGRRRLQPERVKLDDMIETTRAAIQHQLVEADGTCHLDLQAASIVTDRLSLEQILGNLLDNAVKYRARNRPLRIEIRTRHAASGQLTIEVADNGRGMAEQDTPRIFELFRRVGIKDAPGEGVGLAYVQSLVRNLGGEIAVTSRLDEGTTFSLTLPADLRAVDVGNAA